MIVGSSSVDSKHIPYMSMLIIVVCIVFFAKSYSLECFAVKEYQDNFHQAMIGTEPTSNLSQNELQEFMDDHGFQMNDLKNGDYKSLFSHMFIHVGLMHIAGNMLAFWAFGPALEQLFGSLKFTIFYIVCGLVACLGQGFCDVETAIPMVGASGAVAGTMGAYVILFGALGKVKFLMFRIVWDIPAPLFALCWIGTQVMVIHAAGVTGGGVAIVAHLAGFGAGALIALVVKSRVDHRITSESGELKIESKEAVVPLQEEQILAQLLELHPFANVIEALGNPSVRCPSCEGSLDLLNPLGERLVRCQSSHCSQMTYVDERILAGTLPDY